MPKVGWAGPMVFLLIWSLFLGLVGCSVRIAANEGGQPFAPVALAASATPPGEPHDLAVTAIDFDPAWRAGSSFAAGNITLLVAVENRGGEAEKDVAVEVILLGSPDMDVLVTSQATIKEIAPGESQVVRFGTFSSIPLRSAYSLRVEVQPVPGESMRADNSRTYRLEVTVSSR